MTTTTTTSFIMTTLVVAAALTFFFSDNIAVVVKGDPNTSLILKCCGSTPDTDGQARINALAAMDAAIAFVTPGTPYPACNYYTKAPMSGYAVCYRSSSSDEDCKQCLYNAQFRAVDVECRGVTEGRLELADCAVAYFASGPCLATIPTCA